MEMNENKIIEALERSNKWWKEAFRVDFKPRDIYERIQKFMHTRQIIALTGLRRVGKTTIMLKIIEDSISKFGRENIVYFSFDEFKDARLNALLKVYSRLMNKDLDKTKCLILFDEIQKLENWEEQLKALYDNYPDIKFIISGSESLFIRKKSRESLAGRIYEFDVRTLNFHEFLRFRNKNFDNVLLYKEEILKEFKNFLFCNGFPEIINETKEISEKYLKDNVIEKIIYRDIPQIMAVREPAVLEQIFKIILLDPGQIINFDEMAREIGISRQTISLYLDYLEKSFLIRKLYNFSRNTRKTQRKSKKYYPTIISPEIMEKTDFLGKVFETAMVLQLDAEYFWRDSYKHEVDIVKLVNQKILPIEIKLSKIDDKAMKIFMKKFNVDEGLILTYEKKEDVKIDGRKIKILPFYEYLLGAYRQQI